MTVRGQSMEPTLRDGQKILINRLAYKNKLPIFNISLSGDRLPQRGEIIVFRTQSDGLFLIKRVIAIAGDTIEIKDNEVFVNDKSLSADSVIKKNDRGYTIISESISGIDYETLSPSSAIVLASGNIGPYTVPNDKLFVLGDNRVQSGDSRLIGYIDIIDKLTGKLILL